MLHVLDEQHSNSYSDPVLLEFSLFRKEIFNRATLETGLWLQPKGAEMQLICHPLIRTSSNSVPFLLRRAARPSSAWGSLPRKHVTSTFDHMKLDFLLTPPLAFLLLSTSLCCFTVIAMLIVERYTVIHTLMDVWNVDLILSSEGGGGESGS